MRGIPWLIGLGLLGATLAGCAGGRWNPLERWLPREEAAVYYVDADALPLYSEPGREVLAHLPRGEKVLRSRIEKGYAFVRVEATGQVGWVDNAKLNWRLPSESKAATAPDAALPSAESAGPTAAEPTPPAPSKQEEEETGTKPSVFDPF